MALVNSYLKADPKPKRKRRPINPVSEKRKATNVIRRANATERWGERPRCGACAPLLAIGVSASATGCRGWASDLHEVLSRARCGTEENLTDMDGCLPVSRECHAFLTTHPCEAEDAGLALPSKPVRQPTIVRDPRTGRAIERVVRTSGETR